MRRAALGWIAVLAAGPAARVAAQSGPAVTVSSRPSVPFRGEASWLHVGPVRPAAADTLLGVEGTVAGEPLHFGPARGGGFAALFGLPVEGADSVSVSLRLAWNGGTDSMVVALPVARRSYGSERLRVDPRLAILDSAARARLEAEQVRSREVSRRSHDTPRLWSAPVQPPLPSRITSVYGTAREYNGEVTSRHLGTDFAGKVGTPVRAAARGVVALVADFSLAGRSIYLDHGAGLVTGYFHLSRIDVAEGDTVSAGRVIGAVGRTGRVTGPHLHWIARYGEVTVDPMSLVGGMGDGGR